MRCCSQSLRFELQRVQVCLLLFLLFYSYFSNLFFSESCPVWEDSLTATKGLKTPEFANELVYRTNLFNKIICKSFNLIVYCVFYYSYKEMECPKVTVLNRNGNVIYEYFFKEDISFIQSDDLLDLVFRNCGSFCNIYDTCLKRNGIICRNVMLLPGEIVVFHDSVNIKKEENALSSGCMKRRNTEVEKPIEKLFIFVNFKQFEDIPFPVNEEGFLSEHQLLIDAQEFFGLDQERFTYSARSILTTDESNNGNFYAGDHVIIEEDKFLFSFKKTPDVGQETRKKSYGKKERFCKKLDFDEVNDEPLELEPKKKLFVDVDISSLNLSVMGLRFQVHVGTTYENIFEMLSQIKFSFYDRSNIVGANISSMLHSMFVNFSNVPVDLKETVIPFSKIFIRPKK